MDLAHEPVQQLQQQQVQLVEAAVRHKHKAAEQEEKAIEIGRSISQLGMRLTNTAKESEAKVAGWEISGLCGRRDQGGRPRRSQVGTCGSQASGRSCGGGTDNADLSASEQAEMETCMPMEEDTKTPTTMEQDAEVKQLLARVAKEAEQRAYLDRPGTETTKEKEPKPEDRR